METHHANKEKRQPKTSAHECPQCGFAIDLKDLGLREGATNLSLLVPNATGPGRSPSGSFQRTQQTSSIVLPFTIELAILFIEQFLLQVQSCQSAP